MLLPEATVNGLRDAVLNERAKGEESRSKVGGLTAELQDVYARLEEAQRLRRHICAGTGLTPPTSCAGTGRTLPTFAPGLGSPRHICAGTGLASCGGTVLHTRVCARMHAGAPAREYAHAAPRGRRMGVHWKKTCLMLAGLFPPSCWCGSAVAFHLCALGFDSDGFLGRYEVLLEKKNAMLQTQAFPLRPITA